MADYKLPNRIISSECNRILTLCRNFWHTRPSKLILTFRRRFVDFVWCINIGWCVLMLYPKLEMIWLCWWWMAFGTTEKAHSLSQHICFNIWAWEICQIKYIKNISQKKFERPKSAQYPPSMFDICWRECHWCSCCWCYSAVYLKVNL